MIRLGIICVDENQVEKITEKIYEYTHMPPRHRMRGLTEWIFPLLSIEIMTVRRGLGHRFDLAYYDEKVADKEVKEIIWPCCNGSRPKPLEELLWRFPAWRDTITEEKSPQI